jgi:hypothetical protein
VRVPHLSPTTLTTDEQRLILRATAGNRGTDGGGSARDADRLPVEGWVVHLPQHEIGDVGA